MSHDGRATLPHGSDTRPGGIPSLRSNGHGQESAARSLRNAIRGHVYLPGDDAYDEARLPWRRSFDPVPAIVVEAAGLEDVRAAILTAREHDLPFAIQSTGHGAVLPSDGGLLLKTSRMAGAHVDPVRRLARVGPGTLWSEVIKAAAPFGLAPLSGSSPWVGVAGYTLGGGVGLLSRKYGFAADSLVSAEVVTASGEVLTASAGEHPDLFWALRGGGGNFGVVTSLDFRLYPAVQVYAGMSLFDAGRAAGTLARYREWALDEPDEMNTSIVLMRMPDVPQLPEPVRGKRVLALRAFYMGNADDAERLLRPLREAAGEPLVEGIRSTTFAEHSAGPPSPPLASVDHLNLFREMPDAVIEALVEVAGEEADSLLTAVELRHWGGAMARSTPDAGPVGHRDAPFSVLATARFDGSREREEFEAAVDGLAARLQPYATGGSFLNFLSDPARTETAYIPENYRRLAALKRVYDPDNFFRLNHNIPPESVEDAERAGLTPRPVQHTGRS